MRSVSQPASGVTAAKPSSRTSSCHAITTPQRRVKSPRVRLREFEDLHVLRLFWLPSSQPAARA